MSQQLTAVEQNSKYAIGTIIEITGQPTALNNGRFKLVTHFPIQSDGEQYFQWRRILKNGDVSKMSAHLRSGRFSWLERNAKIIDESAPTADQLDMSVEAMELAQSKPTAEIEINGRTYTVESSMASDGKPRYILTGKRGAKYGTMRNRNKPELMFIVDTRSFGIPAGFENIVLTDSSGSLEVAKHVTWSRR